MARHDWQFCFTGTELLEAVDRKIAYHAERLEWWEQEAGTAEGKLRATGIEFREAQFTGGARLDVGETGIPLVRDTSGDE